MVHGLEPARAVEINRLAQISYSWFHKPLLTMTWCLISTSKPKAHNCPTVNFHVEDVSRPSINQASAAPPQSRTNATISREANRVP